MPKPKVVAFAGSARADSFNKKMVDIAARAAEKAGADVHLVDLRDYPMPLFDQDLESRDGMPEHAARLKQLFIDSDGFLIACPEYNSSITPLLKNTIDWISRPAEGEPPLIAYKGKAALLMSASPGALGGLRGLVHVRSILGNIGVIVLPDQYALARAFEAFDDEGNIVDKKTRTTVEGLGSTLTDFLKQQLG